jgi:hypothetical protein
MARKAGPARTSHCAGPCGQDAHNEQLSASGGTKRPRAGPCPETNSLEGAPRSGSAPRAYAQSGVNGRSCDESTGAVSPGRRESRRNGARAGGPPALASGRRGGDCPRRVRRLGTAARIPAGGLPLPSRPRRVDELETQLRAAPAAGRRPLSPLRQLPDAAQTVAELVRGAGAGVTPMARASAA